MLLPFLSFFHHFADGVGPKPEFHNCFAIYFSRFLHHQFWHQFRALLRQWTEFPVSNAPQITPNDACLWNRLLSAFKYIHEYIFFFFIFIEFYSKAVLSIFRRVSSAQREAGNTQVTGEWVNFSAMNRDKGTYCIQMRKSHMTNAILCA